MKRLLTENFSLKATALILAILLWVFVSSKGQTEIALQAPIEYRNIPPGIEISRHTVTSANISIRGHERLLKQVRQGEVTVSLDVGKAKEGEAIIPLKKDDVLVPNTATVTNIEPSSVKIVFERTVEKKVAVRPVITGNPERGYHIRSVEAAPRDIVIEGAKSEIDRVGYLRTEPIDITGLAEDFRQEVELVLPGNIRTKHDRAVVTVKVMRRDQ